jgi:MFS transporter, SP family, sugar:H+ symporter
VFAGCNLAGAIIVFFFLYESSDLSLESVDQMYNDPGTKAWTSGRWAPPGYANRRDLIEQTKAAEAQKPLAGAQQEHFEKAPRNGTAAGGPTTNDARQFSEDGTVVDGRV